MSNNRRKMYLKTGADCEAWIMLPLPAPLYIAVSQFSYHLLDGLKNEDLDFDSVLAVVDTTCIRSEFNIQTGEIYFGNVGGKCVKVAWYVDSSG